MKVPKIPISNFQSSLAGGLTTDHLNYNLPRVALSADPILARFHKVVVAGRSDLSMAVTASATISWEPREPPASPKFQREASSLFDRLSPVPSSPVRTDDKEEEGCPDCLKKFGMAAKKKCCRRCGELFCGDCSASRSNGPPRYCNGCAS